MPWYWIILIAANLPIYLLIGWLLFDDLGGFFETLGYCLKPDLLSWIQGEGLDDMWNELKLGAFIAMCGLIVYGEHWVLTTYVL